ncbi:hypothetical protein [Oceanithermus sp.]
MHEQHFLKSSFRERLIEHLFVGELLKVSWLMDDAQLEVAKPDVDSQGYDLILENRGIMRHVQLKGAKLGARARSQKVHIGLASKPSGCVIWVYFYELTLDLGPFYVFGGEAGKPLPSIEGLPVARHTKGDARGIKHERPQIRELRRSLFRKLDTIVDVYQWLFGVELPRAETRFET